MTGLAALACRVAELDLTGNALTAAGACVLAAALRRNSSLRALTLNDNCAAAVLWRGGGIREVLKPSSFGALCTAHERRQEQGG